MEMSDVEIRSRQREQWTAASKGWISRRREVSTPTRPITDHIVELSRPAEGYRILDLACGAGDPAFTLAKLVGDMGMVLGLDIAEAMVAGADSWAKENDVRNVEFRVIDSELELGVPKESFDLCTCRHGLMFMPNPQLVMNAMAAALKPGGRITVSTWGLPANSPAFTVLGQIIGKYANLPAPDPNMPGLFTLSTAEIHRQLYENISFQDIETHKFDCPVMIAESAEAMWVHVSTMGGPMVKVIQDLDLAAREMVHQGFLETLSNKFPEGKIVLTGEALVTTGMKPLS